MSQARKKPTAHRTSGRTALKRPATKGQGRRKGKQQPPPPAGPFAVLAGRPLVLAGVAVGILVAGIAIGSLLRGGDQEYEAADGREAVTLLAQPVSDGGVRRMDPAVLEARLREAQAAADHQDASIYPPGIALPGVRITDAPEGGSVAPQVAALPPPPPRTAVAPRPASETAGLPAWEHNAVPAPEVDGRPMIAIVIDDMGIDRRRTAAVSSLPGPLTASFLTYAVDGPAQAQAARTRGHELMIHVPMEPTSATIDPGPGALLKGMGAATIVGLLDQGLAPYQGYVGINNHMGSKFTADAASLRPVIDVIKARGLLWLDSRTTAKSAGTDLARQIGVPFAERNIFLDHDNSLDGVTGQLAKVEAVARKYGYAVAIGHPKDHTIAGLKRWLPTLRDKGLVLVPLSAIVRAREAAG